MRLPRLAVLLAVLVATLLCANCTGVRVLLSPPEPPLFQAQTEEIVNRALTSGAAPGVLVSMGLGDGRTVLAAACVGARALEPQREELTPDTLFDLASLTKPIATASSVLKLVELRKVELAAPVARYLPEFGANGKEAITVEQLLRHWGGLIADNPLSDYEGGAQRAWERICALAPQHPPGSKFVYSDVGYIVLGKLVERVSGMSLDQFARREIFEPAGMRDTLFRPGPELRARCAPTQQRDGVMQRGEVHDPRAAALGGVAGHAGLFSTLDDVSRWCRVLLNDGWIDANRVLSKASVDGLLTARWLAGGEGGRTLGLDCDTSYSSPRGQLARGVSVGHTGFTGTSLWIDPSSDCWSVVLTSRLHPAGKGDVRELRREVGQLLGSRAQFSGAAQKMYFDRGQARVLGVEARGYDEKLRVFNPRLTGADVLAREDCEQLRGRRVALLTNRTGRTRDGERTLDLLLRNGIEVVCAMTPEHGFDANLEGAVEDAVDSASGVKLYSLYGKTKRPTREMLGSADTLVFDVQDVGARFYTYATTLGYAMEAAGELGLRVVVLDRPNPIGFVPPQGPLADPTRLDFVAYKPIPIVHGMTLGELARLYREHFGVKCELEVVPCEFWRRYDDWSETGMEWIAPSPNLRNPTQALLYPGVALLEFTNVSVGRGTDEPFERVGAPWIDAQLWWTHLDLAYVPGVRFTPIRFTPRESRFAGEICHGIQIEVTNRAAISPVKLGLTLAWTLLRSHGEEFEVAKVDTLLRNHQAWEMLMRARNVEDLDSLVNDGLAEFLEARQRVLLYP